MNFSTPAPAESTPAEQIESLRDWWSLAGVDLHYNSEPASLLEETAPATLPVEQKLIESIAPTESKPQSAQESTSVESCSENYPKQHDQFLAWLSVPEKLVEARWSQNHVLPTGVIEPEIMVIVGMPEQGSLAQNSLFSEKSAALLANMLKAIGCDSEKTYSASVSLGRSFDGRIDPQYHDALKKRMLHHIGLVRPQRLIFFGDTPSGLFFNENLLTARKNKQFVNHSSYKIEAIATFHPRILIERPEFKAEAWKDLQLLTRITSS
ncbi:MAG: uracil-DNA glycosylase family protein [Parasphingorhabdus sp.]|uniref:uracil-DNA glycosylase family protein n=1 Tax=Parasphingorhabdus sp. TaxID=2709688 RepID=UPI0032970CDF